MVALGQWGEPQRFTRGERHSVLIDTRTGKPVPRMAPMDKDGNILSPADTEVHKVT